MPSPMILSPQLAAASATESAFNPTSLVAIGIAVVSGVVVISMWALAARKLQRMAREGAQLVEKARIEGTAKASALELEAERRVADRRASADKQIAQSLAETKESQERVSRREMSVEKRSEQLEQREGTLEKRAQSLQETEAKQKLVLEENQRTLEQTRQRLAEVSGLTQEQAREQFMQEVRDLSQRDAAQLQHKIIEQAELKARENAREITLMAMQRYGGESATDATVRSVKIPSDDLKGRIIGREGRNIRTFERATGVDVLIDDTPGVIAISCFDRVRQAVAVEALQRLVADGRVHPARIEEVVEQSRHDIHERMMKAGNDAAVEAGVPGLQRRSCEAEPSALGVGLGERVVAPCQLAAGAVEGELGGAPQGRERGVVHGLPGHRLDVLERPGAVEGGGRLGRPLAHEDALRPVDHEAPGHRGRHRGHAE